MTTVENKKPRGRPPAFDREAVLADAMDVFWRLGFEQTSIPDLTDAMGISAQSLYAAFGSKDTLYREAIDLYQRTNGGFIARAFAEEPDAVSGLQRVLIEAASVYTHKPAVGCMITMAPCGPGGDDLSHFSRTLRADGIKAMKAYLEKARAKGEIGSTTDCAAWARFVVNTLYGLSVQARDGTPRKELLATSKISAHHLEILRDKTRKRVPLVSKSP